MKKNEEIGQFLRDAFNKKKKGNARFSRQMIANRLGVSLSFVSQILSGHRALPPDLVDGFSQILDLDNVQRDWLGRNVLASRRLKASSGLLKSTSTMFSPRNPTPEPWQSQPQENFWLLQQWYYLPILETTLLVDFDGTSEFISKRLNLPLPLIAEASDRLVQGGMLTVTDDKYKKTAKYINFHSGNKKEDIRTYHKQSLQRAIHELDEHTSSQDHEKRLITSYTMTVPEEKIAWAQQQISQFLKFMATELAPGTPQEVYQLGIQFIPLTHKS